MSIYKKYSRSKVNYRLIYKQHYGPIPREPNGRSYEIHHIDGDSNNNHYSNLVALTLQEHYDLHYRQRDWFACWKIGIKLRLDPDTIAELSRVAAQERIKNGTHHFLGGEMQRKLVSDGTHHLLGGEVQRKVNARRLSDGTHNFLSGEVQRVTNANRIANGSHPTQTMLTCHCGKTMNAMLYSRWHGSKCKTLKQ